MIWADVLEVAALVALWSFTIWRFVTPQSRRGKAVRLVVLLVTLSFTFNQRGIAYATDTVLHVPDISVPFKNLATVAASAAMVHTVGLLSVAPQTVAPQTYTWLRRCAYGFLAVAAAGMTTVFLIVPRSPARGGFLEERAGTPAVTVYGVLTQLSLLIGLICALVLFRPTGKRAEPGPLRTGLRLLSAGAVVGLLFMVNRLLYLLTHAAGSKALDAPFYVNYVSRSLLAMALLLIAAGGALPALGGVRRWVAHYRALHRLRPLWRELCTAVPSVVLGDPPGRLEEVLPLRSLGLRLYRRIIEIRDAQWLLVGDVDAVVDRARLPARITDDELPFAMEALILRAAIESGAHPGPSAAPSPAGEHDIDGEVRALLAVSRFYRSVHAMPAADSPAADSQMLVARRVAATPVDTFGHNVPSDQQR
jgi:hypothetical protein